VSGGAVEAPSGIHEPGRSSHLLAKVKSFSTVFLHTVTAEKVGGTMARLLRRLISQDRAIANARAAATHLSRCRVERFEVEQFLAQLLERRATRSA
jgi:hypothetical protein